MKRLILCADDYAQDGLISKAILDLLENKKINAASCLVTSPYWPEHARWLLQFKNKADIGLHFDLIEFENNTLLKLLVASHLHLINKKKIKQTLHYQLDLFEKHLGQSPDFIDDHQHIHHLPVIRDALIEVYKERLNKQRPYIRISSNGYLKSLKSFKKFIITASGAMGLKKQLKQKQIPHNAYFSGIYNFRNAKNYKKLFPQFLKETKKNGIIMCHPGLSDFRQHEYDYLITDSQIIV